MTTTTQRTAEMPMPGGLAQMELLDALDYAGDASLYKLCQKLPKLALELEKLGKEPFAKSFRGVSKTVNFIRSDGTNDWDMVTILHSMSRDMIRSIIQGTVAYDTVTRRTQWYGTPSQADEKCPGVYVLGLSRDNCGGKFLNIEEMKRLIDGIQRYRDGNDALQRTGPTTRTQAEKDLVAWVRKVDRAYGTNMAISNNGWFMGTSGDAAFTDALIKGLRKRCNTALDPTEKVRQIQSPLYVGCSGDLRTRIANYGYHQRLTSVNKPLGLVVSILKVLGLPVSISVNVALRTWKANQLPTSEVLLTTLARCLVIQTGFNATQAGAQSGSSASLESLNDARQLVLERSSHMASNLEETLDALQLRLNYEAELEDVGLRVARVDRDVEDLKELVKQLENMKVHTLDDVRAVRDALSQQVSKWTQLDRQWKLILELVRHGREID